RLAAAHEGDPAPEGAPRGDARARDLRKLTRTSASAADPVDEELDAPAAPSHGRLDRRLDAPASLGDPDRGALDRFRESVCAGRRSRETELELRLDECDQVGSPFHPDAAGDLRDRC